MKKSGRNSKRNDVVKQDCDMEKSKSYAEPNCEINKLSLKTDKPYPRPICLEPLMKKSSSKSEDSLDSGIYSRQKSCDSMDSLDSNDGGYNGDAPVPRLKYPATTPSSADTLTPTDESFANQTPQQFDDYWRELQEVEENISDERPNASPTDISDDQDEDREANWLRMAGLSQLLRSGSTKTSARSSKYSRTSSQEDSDYEDDSLSSMRVLNTLTKPQREAVLRRVTSFNRVQKTKPNCSQRQVAIETIFSMENEDEYSGSSKLGSSRGSLDDKSVSSGGSDKLSDIVSTASSTPRSMKSASLPRGTSGSFDDSHIGEIDLSRTGVSSSSNEGTPTMRRYSEASSLKKKTRQQQQQQQETETSFSSQMHDIKSQGRSSSISKSFHKRSFKGFKLKKGVVADGSSKGIETLKMTSKEDESLSHGLHRSHLGTSFKAEKQVSYSEVSARNDQLPNFSLVKDMLGVTRIDDLHQQDLRKVQTLAYIELTALLDRFGIEIKRRKVMKSKTKDAGVFGVPLTTLVKRDQQRLNGTPVKVPLVLKEIVKYLETKALATEGILRKSGSTARVKLLKLDVDNRFGLHTVESNFEVKSSPTWDDAHPHDVASLLKQFLRELPDPLLSNDYIDAFQSCEMIMNRKDQLLALNLLIILIHPTHRDSLEVLLLFLAKVVDNEDQNKMTLNNVAMITAPNLFLPAKQPKKGIASAAERNIKKAAGTSHIVRMLIKYHQLLWTVPATMLSQVRKMNAGHHDKKSHHAKHRVKLFKGVKEKKLSISVVHCEVSVDTNRKVVKIHADDMSITSITVKLDHTLIVHDIYAKFQRQVDRITDKPFPLRIDVTTHALFEIGGNLHERRLDSSANMYALVCTNPDANFVLRKRVDVL